MTDPDVVSDDPVLLVDEARASRDNLTPWERELAFSCEQILANGRRPSDRQVNYLRRAVKRVRGML